MPDWKKESDYPSPEKTSPEEWTWEFLKRNPNYRKDYADMLATYEELEKDHGPRKKWNKINIRDDPRACIYDPPKKEDEAEYQWINRCLENNTFPHRYFILRGLGIKWGLEEIYNPKWKYSKKIKFRPVFYFKYPMLLSSLNIDHLNNFIDHNDCDEVLPVVKDKAIFAFDLTIPIKTQTNKVCNFLTSMQKDLKKELTSHKHHPKVWREYLRIYDAHELGVKSSDIAKEIHSKIFNSKSKKNNGVKGKVRDQLKQAKKMVMENYKYILLLVSPPSSKAPRFKFYSIIKIHPLLNHSPQIIAHYIPKS